MNKSIKTLIALIVSFFALIALVIFIGFFGTKKNNYDFVIADYGVSSLNYKSGNKQVEKKTVNATSTLVIPKLYGDYESFALAKYGLENYELAYPSTNIAGWENYALGGASSVVNSTLDIAGTSHQTLVFEIDPNSKWETGERVSPSDYGFGIELTIDPQIMSHNSDLITDYSGLNGAFDLEVNGGSVSYTDFVVDANSQTQIVSESTGVIFDDVSQTLTFVFDESLNSIPTYFPSLLYQSAFWPVNKDWWYDVGLDKEPWKFGSETKYFLSSGPYKIDSFDRSYGIEFSKNEYYKYANFVNANSWLYKFNDSTLNQANWFASDELSYALIKEDGIDLVNNSDNGEYLYQSMLQPENTYVVFNLNQTNTSPNAKYLQNTNFRKAIMHYIDRESYLKYGGFKNTLPSSNLSDMYYDSEDDFSNTLSDITVDTLNDGTEIKLGQYSTTERTYALKNGSQSVNGSDDKWSSDELGDYYWNKFLIDFGFTKESCPVIELRYVTQSTSNVDPVFQMLTEVTPKTNGKVTFTKVGTSSNFSSIFYYGGANQKYDVASFSDVPNFESPLSNFAKVSNPDSDHNTNYVGEWTLMDGYQAAINSDDYHVDKSFYANLDDEYEQLFAAGSNFVLTFNSFDTQTQQDLLISFESLIYYEAPIINLRGRASIYSASKISNISLPTIGFPRFDYVRDFSNEDLAMWKEINGTDEN